MRLLYEMKPSEVPVRGGLKQAAHIITEGWDRIGGRDAGGRQRRAYHAEFNETERAQLSEMHAKFHYWTMVKGMPRTIRLKEPVKYAALVDRAVRLFCEL